MPRNGADGGPLLIEWSPGRVRVFDPVSRTSKYGSTIAECVDVAHRGNDAVIGISRRSAFIRAVKVPVATRDDVSRILTNLLPPLLPLAPSEYEIGFRLAAESGADGRLAIVGAVKTESLRKIYEEAKERDLRLKLVIPIAFGSWLAARAISTPNCIVVQAVRDSVEMDVIIGGELHYSRSIAAPDDRTEIPDEISRTLSIAKAPEVPIVAMASPEIDADIVDSKEAIEYLREVPQVVRLLFSLQPSETHHTRQARSDRRAALRAQIALAAALLFCAYVALYRWPFPSGTAVDSKLATSVSVAKSEVNLASSELSELQTESKTLNLAFTPAQSFADILTVLSAAASSDACFTGFSIGRNAPLVITGQATSNKTVAAYGRKLAGMQRFKGIKMLYANKAEIEKRPVVEFGITGHAVGIVPVNVLFKGLKK